MVSGQSFASSAVTLPCITSMCSVQCFFWRPLSSFSLLFILLPPYHPSPCLYSSTDKSVLQLLNQAVRIAPTTHELIQANIDHFFGYML